jgi:hypothetical protein
MQIRGGAPGFFFLFSGLLCLLVELAIRKQERLPYGSLSCFLIAGKEKARGAAPYLHNQLNPFESAV